MTQKALPAVNLSWDERNALEKHTDYLKAETAHLEAIGKLPPDARKLLIKTAPKAFWERGWGILTLWALMFMTWVFILMTFQKNVWPR